MEGGCLSEGSGSMNSCTKNSPSSPWGRLERHTIQSPLPPTVQGVCGVLTHWIEMNDSMERTCLKSMFRNSSGSGESTRQDTLYYYCSLVRVGENEWWLTFLLLFEASHPLQLVQLVSQLMYWLIPQHTIPTPHTHTHNRVYMLYVLTFSED